ncbi:MAG TPA: TetR/AcrR family transcriptional regulator [Amycolatopsis sp.]|nr:TetR/AcrR family transcriptional regulator [Amycolatopsis sp.]
MTRDKLLDAAGRLLATQGTGFSLPDLARAAGVSPATTYRHFTSTQDVFREFYDRKIGELVDELRNAADGPGTALERFGRIGTRWAELATLWGTAAAQIRSAEGFLQRARRGEPKTSALLATLGPVVEALAAEREIPRQNVDYAVLLWINVFDERAVVDLTSTLGWTSRRVARALSGSVLAALRATHGSDPG